MKRSVSCPCDTTAVAGVPWARSKSFKYNNIEF
jgi:hypothetical protein